MLRMQPPCGAADNEAGRPPGDGGERRGTPEAVGKEEEPPQTHLSGAVVHMWVRESSFRNFPYYTANLCFRVKGRTTAVYSGGKAH